MVAMNWNDLLSTEKLMPEEAEPKQFAEYPMNDFEKDYRKIVYSAAFRRLQDKTQVFPLDKSDFVRTRLTHSIEVSTIAKQLGIMAVNNFAEYHKDELTVEQAEVIPSILQCAGLLHDLGNPPFGHFGETTIGDWFRDHLSDIDYRGKPVSGFLLPQMYSDLSHFEGNAQALRILLKAKHDSGVNVSKAIISTLVKYPVSSQDLEVQGKKKFGIYLAEQDLFQKISKAVGTVGNDGLISRHPLTYLLEAADDIAYATSDLEDAYKKGLFTLDSFIEYFRSKCAKVAAGKKYATCFALELVEDLEKRRGSAHTPAWDAKAFKEWLNYTRKWLMHAAVFGFSKNYDAIMKGVFIRDVFYGTNHAVTLQVLKDAMGEFVFNSAGILKLELSAQAIISTLLNGFVRAVIHYGYEDKDAGYVLSKADKKYINLLSQNYRDDYEKTKTGNECMDLYLRLLMVADYVSGMTDTYARTLYRELIGVE